MGARTMRVRDPPRILCPTSLTQGGLGRCQHARFPANSSRRPEKQVLFWLLLSLLSPHLPQHHHITSPEKVSLQDIFPKARQTKLEAEVPIGGVGNSDADRGLAQCGPSGGGAVGPVGTRARKHSPVLKSHSFLLGFFFSSALNISILDHARYAVRGVVCMTMNLKVHFHICQRFRNRCHQTDHAIDLNPSSLLATSWVPFATSSRLPG